MIELLATFQTLLIILTFLGGHIEGFKSLATYEGQRINLANAYGQGNRF